MNQTERGVSQFLATIFELHATHNDLTVANSLLFY